MSDQLKDIARMIDQGTSTPEPDEPVVTPVTTLEPVEELTEDAPLLGDESDDDDPAIVDGEGEGDSDIRTIAQLAEAIDVDAEFLYNIEIGMPEGEDPIPLGEMKDQYQQTVRENRQLQDRLATQQQELQEAQSGANVSMQASQEAIQAQAKIQSISDKYNEVDWPRYEQENPGEAVLAKQRFQEAFSEANGQLQQVNQYMSQMSHQELMMAAQRTMELIPEWQDDEVRGREEVEIQQAMVQAGYTPQMVAQARDPIAISLMRELVKLRAEKAASVAAVETVKKAPKVLSTGAMRRQGGGQATKALVERAKSSGRTNDQVAAAKAILTGAGKR